MNRKSFNLLWAIPISILLTLPLFFFLPRAGADSPGRQADQAASLLPASDGMRIAVASDLHLDPDNTDKANASSETVYNMELVDAMLWDAQRQGADILLLTGDLVNGGREHKHTALVEKLRQAEESGMKIYVLPGNHDLYPVTQTAFAETYAPFGYDEAYSRDGASLSYCVVVDNLMLLMLDTAGYDAHAIDLPYALSLGYGASAQGSAGTNRAFLSDQTLAWARSMLEEAKERGFFVLCASHYNLLPPISRVSGNGYYVENGQRMAALLEEYRVPLTLSGHMHLRGVYQENGLTELLTECLTAYPVAYSVLDLTDAALCYTPCPLDVAAWAAETRQNDPVLLNFSAWQQELRRAGCRYTVGLLSEKRELSPEDAELAGAFFYDFLEAYWHGRLYARAEALMASEGYRAFMACAEGSSYGPWVQETLETASPLLAGFVLKLP